MHGLSESVYAETGSFLTPLLNCCSARSSQTGHNSLARFQSTMLYNPFWPCCRRIIFQQTNDGVAIPPDAPPDVAFCLGFFFDNEKLGINRSLAYTADRQLSQRPTRHVRGKPFLLGMAAEPWDKGPCSNMDVLFTVGGADHSRFAALSLAALSLTLHCL